LNTVNTVKSKDKLNLQEIQLLLVLLVSFNWPMFPKITPC